MIAIWKASRERRFESQAEAYPRFGGRAVRPARGRPVLIAFALGLASASISFTLLPSSGEAAQAAPALQTIQPSAARQVRTTEKADRLVKPAKLQGGCDGAWGNEPLDCLLRTT